MLFASLTSNEFGLTLLSLIGVLLGFWAFVRTLDYAPSRGRYTTEGYTTAPPPSQDGELLRQMQGVNKHVGELRGELRQLQTQINTNEEGDETLRDRYEKLEDALNKFAFQQRTAWGDLTKTLDGLVPDSDEPVKDEDDEEEDEPEEEEENCLGCELPKEDCICKEEEEDDDD